MNAISLNVRSFDTGVRLQPSLTSVGGASPELCSEWNHGNSIDHLWGWEAARRAWPEMTSLKPPAASSDDLEKEETSDSTTRLETIGDHFFR
jgi:hypothetical protein